MVYENGMKIDCVDEKPRETRNVYDDMGRADVLITE